VSDDIDEWAHELRCELDKATAEGRTTVTITAPVTSLYVVADRLQSYFREEGTRCMMCDSLRRMNDLADRLKNYPLGRNPNWRRDLKGPRK
jgi:hypothetical protein